MTTRTRAIVLGNEPALLALIADQLDAVDVASRGLVGDEDAWDAAFHTSAEAIVLVERLPRVGSSRVAEERDVALEDAALREALRAARAPSKPLLIWVTSRPPDDPAIGRLARHGAPYVVVRTGEIVARDRPPFDAIDRECAVLDGLAVPARGLSTFAGIADTVKRAFLDEQVVGRILECRHDDANAWPKAIAEMGARPRVVSKMRAAVARWLGQPVLDDRASAAVVMEPSVELRAS